jgi:hypothetical protein
MLVNLFLYRFAKFLLVMRIEYSINYGCVGRLDFHLHLLIRSLWNKVNQQVQSGLFYYTKLNCNFAFHISQVHRIAVYLNRDIFQKGVDCRFVNWDNRFLACVV